MKDLYNKAQYVDFKGDISDAAALIAVMHIISNFQIRAVWPPKS